MSQIPARYYDGRDSTSHEVQVRLMHDTIVLSVDDRPGPAVRLNDVVIEPRLGNTPRVIRYPDGGRLEIEDHAAFEAALAASGHKQPAGILHTLENHMGLVLFAVIVTVFTGWATITYAIPWAAGHAAKVMPASVAEVISEQTLEQLDEVAFQPSELDDATRARLDQLFVKVVQPVAGQDHSFRLEFRDSPALGANAIALPSGIVVVTDDLVKVSEDDMEIYAVLSHEVGHVMGRHGLRHVLQDSAVVLVIGLITGDVVSTTNIAATLPVFLMQMSYSREFEREADAYAFKQLKAEGIPLHHFANILERISGDGAEPPPYLSSHPATEERTRAFHAQGAQP